MHFHPTLKRTLSPRNTTFEAYESSSSTDGEDSDRTSTQRSRPSTSAASATLYTHSDYLFPPPRVPSRHPSPASTAASTPVPSRPSSPFHPFYSSGLSSSCPSDTDDEPSSPLLPRNRHSWWTEHRAPWWRVARRRRRHSWRTTRLAKKWLRNVVRHPLFPSQPITIVLTLILLSIFAILLTLLLIYILNPDKEPLPWRAYCAYPSVYNTRDPPPISAPYPSPNTPPPQTQPFPPPNLDSLPPAGIFLGVFSVDSAIERRQLVRSTWASHPRSRDGAGDGDEGAGTSRTIVRFVVGQPRKDWERRVKLEMEMYNDIVILPMQENMNTGKTHTFFSWASINAWVPPVYVNSTVPPPRFTYSNFTSSPPALASHDPYLAWQDLASGHPRTWVRPDYVVKVDDDSFVMLAELEARLRVELHAKDEDRRHASPFARATNTAVRNVSATTTIDAGAMANPRTPTQLTDNDPLIYWGYLVTNKYHQFMAGELYGLSWSLVDWVAKDPTVKTMTKGAEDKQTAKWMRTHPRQKEVRWASERCWIYDHPRSGTVYAHGFLFPSEVTRVKRQIREAYGDNAQKVLRDLTQTVGSGLASLPTDWARSTVSKFRVRYTPPLSDLSTHHSVEALVEGSEMSTLSEGSPMTPEYAWDHREGRRKRYQGQRVGGTVVVHFIKKHMWFLETALALLEGDERSDHEIFEDREERAGINLLEDGSPAPVPWVQHAVMRHRRR